jgi:hypothetical protein
MLTATIVTSTAHLPTSSHGSDAGAGDVTEAYVASCREGGPERVAPQLHEVRVAAGVLQDVVDHLVADVESGVLGERLVDGGLHPVEVEHPEAALLSGGSSTF